MTYALNILHEGLSFPEYIAAPGINATGLKELVRSPLHYMTAKEAPDKKTPSKVLGGLLHMAILETERFIKHRVVCPGFDLRTKVGKAGKAEWEAALKPEDIEVPADCEEPLLKMADKVHAYPAARRLLEKGVRETTLFWNDPRTQVLCKARPDFFSATRIPVDLKTARDARPEAFSKAMWEYRYDIQAAHYLAGFTESKLADGDEFAWLVIENAPPYEIAVYTAGLSVLGVGSQWREQGITTYATCLKSGEWPGYERKASMIELPGWAKGVDDATDG